MTSGNSSKLTVWWKAIRYHFVPPSIFPAVLGSLVALVANHVFYPFYFLLVLVGVVVNHMALNMADDYFDYKHAVDRAKPEDKNPYSGGSGTLSGGLIKPSGMLKAFVLCFLITITIGLFLTITRGFPVLVFGLFGVFCSVFYTAPPIHFSHLGLGELAQLLSFGTIIGLGSYFVQTQTLSLGAFVGTLPLGIMLFSMIIINEIPDYQEDRLAGKLTLVTRYGKKTGVKLYAASWVCTYSVIVIAALLNVIPLTTLLALVSLPFAFSSILTLRKNYENPKAVAPANLNMIKAHAIASFGLIIGYAVSGLTNGANQIQLLIILVLLTIFYIPATFMIIKPRKSR